MRRPRRRAYVFGMIAVFLFLSALVLAEFTGVVSHDALKATAAGQKQVVKIGYLVGDQLHQYTLPIGLAKGYFDEEGLEVKTLEYSGAGMLMQHFGANECDLGLVGVSGVIAAKAGGMDAIIVDSLNHGGSALVVDQSVTKFEDLKGQPVGNPGIGSNHHTLLTMLEEKYNTPVKKVTIKPTDMPIFAKNKEVKAIICYEPWPSRVMAMAGFKMLFGSDQIVPDQQCCVWVTSSKFIKEHPDVVEKCVRINAKATKYILDHPDEAIKIISKASGHPEPILKEAYKNMIYPWPPVVEGTSSNILLQGIIDAGKVNPDAIKPDRQTWWNALYDKSFEQKLIDTGYIKKLEKESVPK